MFDIVHSTGSPALGAHPDVEPWPELDDLFDEECDDGFERDLDSDPLVDPGMPPGAVLALGCEVAVGATAVMDDGELLDLITAAEKLTRWAAGMRTRAVAAYADRHPTGTSAPPPGGTIASPVTRWLPDELGMTLHLPRLHARAMIANARRLAHVLPDTLDALCDGRIDERRAEHLCDATRVLDDDTTRAVQATVLARADGQTLRQWQDRTRRAIHRHDPDGAHRRHRAARTDRRATMTPQPDGMAALWILGAAADTEASFTMLTRLAHSLGPEDPRTLDQRRSDLAHQIMQGRLTITDTTGLHDHATAALLAAHDSAAHDSAAVMIGAVHDAAGPDHDVGASRAGPADMPPQVVHAVEPDRIREILTDLVADALDRRPRVADTVRKPLIQVVVGLDTLLGTSDRPGELAGHGPVDADTARALAAGGVWNRLVTEPLSGALLDHGRTTYTPPAATDDHVRARDQQCRGPGCTRRARDCDLDHHVPWESDGTTDAPNLHALCRHHHRLKDADGWNVVTHPDGSLTWISPAGRRHTTEPYDYRPFTEPLSPPAPAATPTLSRRTSPESVLDRWRRGDDVPDPGPDDERPPF